jgi:hypothetical protein
MRLQWGSTSIRFGKPPFPKAEDPDTLSRLARAYGVRRDMWGVAKAVRVRAGLPSDSATLNAIVGVVGATISMGFSDPHALDRLAAGKGVPKSARDNALMSSKGHARLNSGHDVESPEDLVDAVFADFRDALARTANGPPQS